MCPKPRLAASRAAILLAAVSLVAIAPPALAWPFGGAKSATPATAAAAPAPLTAKQADAALASIKATPAQRAEADRQDPVIRVAFWTHETTLDPNDAEAGVGLAAALRACGRYSEAADAATRILTVHPKLAAAMLELARAQVSANHGFYAIKPLQDVAAIDPRDARPWVLLGVAYEQNEQPDLARSAYEQALKLAPDSPAALSNYALFRATHGEPDAAETLLRKAVSEPGAGPQERQNLALVLGLQGKMGEAERLIRQDLPPEVADTNLAYLRALNAPGSGAAASPARSWSAVKASETAQTKAPG